MAFVLPAIGSALADVGIGSSAAAASTAAAGSAAAGTAGALGASSVWGLGLEGAGVSTAAAAAPSWLAYASTGASVLGAGLSAVGSLSQAAAESGASKYNASIESQNANIAKNNAAIAGQAGEAQAFMQQERTRSLVGQIKANQAASGIDVNQGSAPEVRSSAASLGELDAMQIKSNATRQAYGYNVQSASDTASSGLSQYEASNANTAGAIGAASTFLGGTGNAGLNWMKYQMNSGFGFGSGL
jgi:hypothetical protein